MNLRLPTKQLVLLAVMWLSFENTHAQNESLKPGQVKQMADTTIKFKNNVIYLEGLGNMGGLSLNYERKVYEHKHGFFTARIGIGFGGIDLAGFPVLLNYVFFKRNHHFEIGGGVRLIAAHYTNSNSLYNFELDKHYSVATASFTYRYQKPGGKFIFRAGWTPLLYHNPSNDFLTFLALFTCGISAGYVC